MQEITEITGMIIKAEPINDYDRRVVLLTRERDIGVCQRCEKAKQQSSGGDQPFLFRRI